MIDEEEKDDKAAYEAPFCSTNSRNTTARPKTDNNLAPRRLGSALQRQELANGVDPGPPHFSPNRKSRQGQVLWQDAKEFNKAHGS
jgi:hypothetical protein